MKRGRMGILVGGGPAPGINGVIAAATLEGINQGFEVLGFLDGYKWLAQGDTQHWTYLTAADVRDIHLRGGSILGTSRTNPAEKKSTLGNACAALRKLDITALVTIGGDDTAFGASQIYRAARRGLRIAHVPKTIDNDLPLPGVTPTFGFETARHLGTLLLRNLMEDARTTSRWYVVISMGRTAGHLALGIGKAAAAPVTIIPEEFGRRDVTVAEVCDIIIGSIIKCRAAGLAHGVAVLAEGLIERMGEEELRRALPDGALERYGKIVRDDYGNLRMSEIDFGRLVKDILSDRCQKLGLKLTFVNKDLGYELRCADPIPFDAEYTRHLGYSAVRFLLSKEAARFGAIVTFVNGKLIPRPFEQLLNKKTGRMRTRLVDVASPGYACAQDYMIRLKKADFADAVQLGKLAKVVALAPDQFRQRFGYLAGPK